MSLVLSSAGWLWLDFFLAFVVGFALGSCFLELVDSMLYWIEDMSRRFSVRTAGDRRRGR